LESICEFKFHGCFIIGSKRPKEIRISLGTEKIVYNIRIDKVYASSKTTTARFICKAPGFSLTAPLALIAQTVTVIRVIQSYSHCFVFCTFILNFCYDLFIKSQFVCLHTIHNDDTRNANVNLFILLARTELCKRYF
jgi:hypothetical protein